MPIELSPVINSDNSSRCPSSSVMPILTLSAVLCIKASHYVAFVRAGADECCRWVLFDSMAGVQGKP